MKRSIASVFLQTAALGLAVCAAAYAQAQSGKGAQSGLAPEAAARLAAMKAALAANPKDINTRTKLIVACLGEFKDPAEAARLVTPDLNEDLRKFVPLAAKPVGNLDERACMELASWYAEQAGKAASASQVILFARAKACCERFLTLHATGDATRLKVSMLLDEIFKKVPDLGPPPRTLALDLGRGVKIPLVLAPAGKFLIGSVRSEKGRQPDEGPQHEVTIARPFYIGVCEVTQEQYAAVTGTNPSKGRARQKPVEMVSWNAAIEFCRKASAKTNRTFRLPTEAEWEYACRAGTKTRFFFGDDEKDLKNYAWYDGNRSGIHPVAQRKPNPWGLYDTYGNVSEWCAAEGQYEIYTLSKWFDPRRAGYVCRVIRGGCWHQAAACCRSASRSISSPESGQDDTGFRVVVDVPEPVLP